jgi:hypothetical protein
MAAGVWLRIPESWESKAFLAGSAVFDHHEDMDGMERCRIGQWLQVCLTGEGRGGKKRARVLEPQDTISSPGKYDSLFPHSVGLRYIQCISTNLPILSSGCFLVLNT